MNPQQEQAIRRILEKIRYDSDSVIQSTFESFRTELLRVDDTGVYVDVLIRLKKSGF